MLRNILLLLLSLTYIAADHEIASIPMNLALINFDGMCKCELGYTALVYKGHGCWCGTGASGTPVDEVDTCCKARALCYRAARTSGKCTFMGLYTDMYNWDCIDRIAICKGKTECEKALCACDTAAVRCWARQPKPKSKKKCNKA
ncbi:unnamed protein product [Cylicostephanus goldi]|uniref:Phospholipase A2 n=1 Tax=Cylicostephanus goldi TaxID=71465 RepID=A0A3P6RDS8_CYLGO|nr:unnamed protein product [Cylicostephanus goldi]